MQLAVKQIWLYIPFIMISFDSNQHNINMDNLMNIIFIKVNIHLNDILIH